jgi:hypothetical protein
VNVLNCIADNFCVPDVEVAHSIFIEPAAHDILKAERRILKGGALLIEIGNYFPMKPLRIPKEPSP